MISKTLFSALLLGAAMIALPVATVTPAYAISNELNAYLGDEPTLFDTADQGVQAFKDTIAKGDIAAVAKLLGLDPARLEKSEGIADILSEIRDATAEMVQVNDEVALIPPVAGG